MKNIRFIKRTLCFLSFPILLGGCEKFLEENPKDLVATSNFYKTEADAISAVNSVYSWLGAYNLGYGGNTAGVYHSTFWLIQGLASDELYSARPGFPDLEALGNVVYNSENASVLEVWRMHYKVINYANIAITKVPAINMDPTLRTRLVNEAKFLRGLLYFNMVRMFGSVPLLLTDSEPMQPQKESVANIYAQIIKDLQDAEALPPSYPAGNGKGRATSGAAKATLAKVYLTMGLHQQAADKAWEIIQPGGVYGLFDDFADVWKYENRNGKETVFSVSFGDGGGKISFWEVAAFNVHLLPTELATHIPTITNTQGWYYTTQALYDAYEPNDERRDVTLMTEFTKPDNTVINLDRIYVRKYWDQVANPTTSPSESDFPVIRYSDVLLTYAEAKGALEDFTTANLYLNKVRFRANLTDVNPQNKPDFVKALLEERQREFAVEGHRWFDLVRLGKLIEKIQEAKNITPSTDYYLFPIPLREVDLNPNLRR